MNVRDIADYQRIIGELIEDFRTYSDATILEQAEGVFHDMATYTYALQKIEQGHEDQPLGAEAAQQWAKWALDTAVARRMARKAEVGP